MDLFSQLENADKNYLPKDGVVNYYGSIFAAEKSKFYLQHLLEHIRWQNDTLNIAGKYIVTDRKIAWYGDEAFELMYSSTKKTGYLWTNTLLELKIRVENITKETYNSCLLNLYHTGEEGLGWHSDCEKGAVASLTFGATRKFVFKHKRTKEKVEFNLMRGDLLVMKGSTQKHWVHKLPPTKKVVSPRINLTFRTINF